MTSTKSGYRNPAVPQSKIPQPELVLAIGRLYLVTRFHTGDFRGRCLESLFRSARFEVTDPMKSSLHLCDQIEIPFKHAEFLPVVIEQFQKIVEGRP